MATSAESADVLIVGAGAAGCALAYLLAREGSNVLLAERTSVTAVDEEARVATLRNLDTGDETQVRYATLVAADGANSTTRYLVTGRRPRTVVSFEAETARPQNGSRIVQRVYPAVAGGCWLIPQGASAVVGCLFFPEASHDPVGDMRQRVLDFADELGIPCWNLRGAPVPAGDDILLRSPGGTYFVGDAASLIEPALGAGLHLALQSAIALADDLAGNARYEETMTPTAAHLQEAVDGIAMASLRLGFAALKAGKQ